MQIHQSLIPSTRFRIIPFQKIFISTVQLS